MDKIIQPEQWWRPPIGRLECFACPKCGRSMATRFVRQVGDDFDVMHCSRCNYTWKNVEAPTIGEGI